MRTISQTLDSRLHLQTQARATDAALSMYARISRGTTVLASNKHLDRVKIADASGSGTITDVSVSVEHSKLGGADGAIWAAMADGGRLRVFRSGSASALSGTSFTELDCSETAVSCSVCFDSVTVRKADDTEEWVTERVPFVFWVDADGALHCRKWFTNEDTILVSSDAVRVTSVRASYSQIERFNFGLIVFCLLESGSVIYRQYIDGVWYDAEVVQFGPENVTFSGISAFRTWDYRVGIQGITEDGDVYELFTQYEGIGTRNQEHIEISGIAAVGTLTAVTYHDTQETEHMEISGISADGHLWSALDPEIIDAWNVGIEVEE